MEVDEKAHTPESFIGVVGLFVPDDVDLVIKERTSGDSIGEAVDLDRLGDCDRRSTSKL